MRHLYLRAISLLLTTLFCFQATASPLWQVGIDNLSQSEFKGKKNHTYNIPRNWHTRLKQSAVWPDIARLTFKAGEQPAKINYMLKAIPEHGAELSFRVLTSTKVVPQLAVYSNGILMGLIQTWGTRGTASEKTLQFSRIYRLYIPSQFMQAGRNTLRLHVIGQPYGGNDALDYLEMDYLRLDALDTKSTEPIHGALLYLGTTLTQAADGLPAFRIDQNTVRHAQPLLEWLGIAYSGNMMRAPFWTGVARVQTHQKQLLETFRDLNICVLADWLHLNAYKLTEDGELSAAGKAKSDELFKQYGNLIQYVEIANEPGLIGPISKERVLAYAHYLKQVKPQHIKLVAPGWAYKTWSLDVKNRQEVETYADYMGGHAYGLSFRDDNGGSMVENLKSAGPVTDGFEKPMIATEFGANEWHYDWDARDISTQTHAAAFDRVMRAHVAVAYAAIQHAAFFAHAGRKYEKFSLFKDVGNWDTHDPMDTQAWPGIDGEESRLQTFRRLALAYATHGSPLTWEPVNIKAMQNRPVYVRCVDTSTLSPLVGSNATASKVLLNFINFDDKPATVKIKVTLPQQGTWTGKRIGSGNKLSQATTSVRLEASPQITLEIPLPVREAVQYILTPLGH